MNIDAKILKNNIVNQKHEHCKGIIFHDQFGFNSEIWE